MEELKELMEKTGFKIEEKSEIMDITMTNMNCILFHNNYVLTWNEIHKDMLKWDKLGELGRISE